jgi:hypothetical protein
MRPNDQVNVYELNDQHCAGPAGRYSFNPRGLGGGRLSDMAPATLPSRSASRRSTAASALSSNNPPYLVSVHATLLCPAHSETSRTLQPAATMIATKLCRSP